MKIYYPLFIFTLALAALSTHKAVAVVDNFLPDFNKLVQESGISPKVPCDPPANPKAESNKRWDELGFKNANLETWTESTLYSSNSVKDNVVFTHGITLTTILFRNTGWTRDEVLTRFRRLAEVYKQCGIKVQQVNFVESDALNGWIDIDGIVPRKKDRESKILSSLPVSEKPIYFYVRSSKDANSAYAQPEFVVGYKSPLLDTIWITRDVIHIEKTCNDPSYSVEAHELGHTLANFGHVTDRVKNFLAGACDLVNDKIRDDQCSAMKKHKSVRAL
jgi:hypothetical protein